MSVRAIDWLITGTTLVEETFVSKIQSHGTAGARAVIMSSILPYSAARWVGSVMSFAEFSAELTAGSLSCGQFELLVGLPVIVPPLNGTSIIAWPSLKSFCHPTFGQVLGSFATTEQNFVYATACSTGCNCTLNPSAASCDLATCASLLPGGVLSATMVTVQLPVHLP